jgi:hypothetical protein
MTTAALLLREVEAMPEESAVEVLDFARFLRSKQTSAQPLNEIAIKDAYGIFKGIDTYFKRDEDDRV